MGLQSKRAVSRKRDRYESAVSPIFDGKRFRVNYTGSKLQPVKSDPPAVSSTDVEVVGQCDLPFPSFEVPDDDSVSTEASDVDPVNSGFDELLQKFMSDSSNVNKSKVTKTPKPLQTTVQKKSSPTSPKRNKGSSVSKKGSPTSPKNNQDVKVPKKIRPAYFRKDLDLESIPFNSEDDKDIEPGVSIKRHHETGLLICAEGHDPKVVLPNQIRDHLIYRHGDKHNCSAELRDKIRDHIKNGTATSVPTNVHTRLPAIPVVRERYCTECCKIVRFTWDGHGKCTGKNREIVYCQYPFRGSYVILGPTPPKVNIIPATETSNSA